jgi:hypothetical protein
LYFSVALTLRCPLSKDVFGFRQAVPVDGFRWVQARLIVNDREFSAREFRQNRHLEDKPQWVLTSGIGSGVPYRTRVGNPFEQHTGLFRYFAQLSDTREAMLGFANEFGSLGIPRELGPPEERTGDVQATSGETWKDWVLSITKMRRAVEIWDLVVAANRSGLAKFIHWQDEVRDDAHQVTKFACWIYDTHAHLPRGVSQPARHAVPFPGRRSEVIEPFGDLFKPGDILTPAAFLVQRWINDHLEGRVSPRLVFNTDLGKRVVQIVPKNLLAGMWLQFARAVEDNTQFRSCRECCRWFAQSHKQADRRTVRREFCSDPCKSKNYRRRKEATLRLKAEGKSVNVIASTLETDVETIKKWVGRRRG